MRAVVAAVVCLAATMAFSRSADADVVGHPALQITVSPLVVRFTNDGATYVRPQMHVRISRAGRVVKKLDDSTTAIFAG